MSNNLKSNTFTLSQAVELWWDNHSLASMLFEMMPEDSGEEMIPVAEEPKELNLLQRAIKKPKAQKGLKGQGAMFGRKGQVTAF